MELTDELKGLFIRTAVKLTGSARRVFMAQVTQMLGKGGQRRAEVGIGLESTTSCPLTWSGRAELVLIRPWRDRGFEVGRDSARGIKIGQPEMGI